jgi:hypothetical protein
LTRFTLPPNRPDDNPPHIAAGQKLRTRPTTGDFVFNPNSEVTDAGVANESLLELREPTKEKKTHIVTSCASDRIALVKLIVGFAVGERSWRFQL